MIDLQTPLQYMKGVGPRRAADLQRVGLTTVEDFLYRFPIRYEDRGSFQTIASLRPGTSATIVGEVVGSGLRPTRRPRFKIFEILVRDRTGSLRAIWFNQPFLNDVFHPRQRVVLYGKLELTSHGLQLQNPQYELLKDAEGAEDAEDAERSADDEMMHTGRIVSGRLGARMCRQSRRSLRAPSRSAPSHSPPSNTNPCPRTLTIRRAFGGRLYGVFQMVSPTR